MDWSWLLLLLFGAVFLAGGEESSHEEEEPVEPPDPLLEGATPGTEFDDRLAATEDGEAVRGLGGDDVIDTEYSGNTLFGEEGNDTLTADGDARLVGGPGDDWLRGYDSTLEGGEGNDTLYGFDGSELDGGAGDDQLTGLRGVTAEGGDGNDTIALTNPAYGGPFAPAVGLGGEGDDALSLWGNGSLDGGEGDDTLRADLADGTDEAVLTGGDGADRFEVGTYPRGTLGNPQDVTITDFTPGEDSLVLDLGLGQSGFDAEGLPGGLSFEEGVLNVEVETGRGVDFDVTLEGVTELEPGDVSLHDYVTGEDFPFVEKATNEATTPNVVNLYGDGDDSVLHDGGRAVVNLGEGNNIFTTTGGSPEVVAGAGDDAFIHVSTDAPAETPYIIPIEPVIVPEPGDNPALASYHGGAGDDTFLVTGNYAEGFGGEGDDTFVGELGSGPDVAFHGGSGADTYDVQFGQDVFDPDAGSEVTLTITPEALEMAQAGEEPGWLPVDAEITVVVPAGSGPLSIVPGTSYDNYGLQHFILQTADGTPVGRFLGGPATGFEPTNGSLPANITVVEQL